MKKRVRLLCLLLCVAIIFSTLFSANTVFAEKTNINVPSNNAWLSDFYIRESSTDFIKNKMVPDISQYQKDEKTFRLETKILKDLINIDISDIYSAYVEILNKAFGIVGDAVVNVKYEDMKNYLQTEWKIIYPEPQKPTDQTYTAIMYACLKYDLMFPIIGKHFAVPENTTLDRAVVLVATTILDDKEVGNDIDTLEKYAVLNLKRTLVKEGYLESVNANISDEELLLLYKIMVAEKEGYVIENKALDTYTKADKDYVSSAYAASLIKTKYGIAFLPEQVHNALTSSNPDAIEILILTGLINSNGGTVNGNESVAELLKQASSLGCFKIDNEFYSDIYKYDVYLTYNCKEIWMTPFAYAAELGKDHLKYVKIKINGKNVQNSRSSRIKVNNGTSKVTVELNYDDGKTKDSAKYLFTIHNGKKELPTVPVITPSSLELDYSYNVPKLSSADQTKSKYQLKEQSTIQIEQFETDSSLMNTVVTDSSSDNIDNLSYNEENANNEDIVPAKNDINKFVLPIIIVALSAVIIAAVVFIVKRKKRNIK